MKKKTFIRNYAIMLMVFLVIIVCFRHGQTIAQDQYAAHMGHEDTLLTCFCSGPSADFQPIVAHESKVYPPLV